MTTPEDTEVRPRRKGCLSTAATVGILVVGLAVSVTRRDSQTGELDPAVVEALSEDIVFADLRVIDEVPTYDDTTRAIVRTYLRANLAVDMIRNGGNIPHDYVGGYFTGDALADIQADIDALEAAAQARDMEQQHHSYAGFVDVVGATATHATIEECVVRDRPLIDRDTRQVLDDTVTTQHLRASLEFTAETGWLINEIEVLEEWDGIAGCADE